MADKTKRMSSTLPWGVTNMLSLSKRLALAALGFLILWANGARLLHAQADNAPAARASFRSMPMADYSSSSAAPYYPYYPGYYYDPYGGYLRGAADVINAQGQFLVSTQQAYLQREQVRQARLDNRRRSFDEYLYERERRPTLEDERERARLENLRRSRNDPPITEIWSGKALNDLLLAAQQQQAKGVRGPNVPVEEETLKNINVTSGAHGGSLGVLRDGGRLHWPLELTRPEYQAERSRLDQLAATAYTQAVNGAVDPNTLRDISNLVESLQTRLRQGVADSSPSDYIKAKRYLNDLDSAVKVLEDPNVGKYANRKLAARGGSVSDLVTEMSGQGLRFAPAVAGDENAYVALHRAFVSYAAPAESYKAWDPATK